MFPYRYSHQDLEFLDKNFDHRKKLLHLPLKKTSKNRYPFLGQLKLHLTRESLDYALLLLSEDIYIERVESILSVIVRLQNHQVGSIYYGGWPKYLESTYLRVSGKYWKFDRNWTEFIGLGLCEILLNDAYRTRLRSDLITHITFSLTHAALAIQQRKTSYVYTNIYVLGICVSLLAGKLLNNDSSYQYGLNSLAIIYSNTVKDNCFAEYNSPIYSLITLKALFYLRTIFRNKFHNERETYQQIEKLYQLAWREIANYFHPATEQWAGPHSRSYSTLLDSYTSSFFRNKINDLNTYEDASLAEKNLDTLRIPAELSHLFTVTDGSKMITRSVSIQKPTQVLRTYFTNEFTLGTVNYSDLWEQRNSLVAYWGTPEEPTYLRLRCLHNRKDFPCAQFFSVQDKGNIIGAINFATDVAKENPYLPKAYKDLHGFKTSDLRVRFEFGNATRIPDFRIYSESNSSLIFQVESMYFQILFPHIDFSFDNFQPFVSVSRGNRVLSFDLILLSGKRNLVNFSQVNTAVVSFFLQVSDRIDGLEGQFPIVKKLGNQLTLIAEDLSLSVSAKPESLDKLREYFTYNNHES